MEPDLLAAGGGGEGGGPTGGGGRGRVAAAAPAAVRAPAQGVADGGRGDRLQDDTAPERP